MRIDRIDPFRIEWSHHGTIALATESVGIQFLVLDAKALYESGEVKFSRLPSPSEVDARVLSMAYGPMLTSSNGGSLLAVVLSTNLFLLLEEKSSEGIFCIYKSPAPAGYTSTCWSGDKVIVSDELGILYTIDRHSFGFTQYAPPIPVEGAYVTHLVSTELVTIAALKDNSCWRFKGGSWDRVVEPSSVKPLSIHLSTDQLLLVQRCHDVLKVGLDAPSATSLETTTLSSYLPGTLVPITLSDFYILHSNGKISESRSGLTLPSVTGKVECAARHPTLPLGVLVVGPQHDGWKYPMLSTRTYNVALYPLDGDVEFCFRKAALSVSFLAAKAKDFSPTVELDQPSEIFQDLSSAFLSSKFDALRVKWIYSDNRAAVLHDMRLCLYEIINKLHSVKNSSLDQVVLSWYSGGLSPGVKKLGDKFTLSGDFVSETFSYGEFFKDSETIVSVDGNEWKRCALTGLPLLSIDTRKSADGYFAAYKYSPTIAKEKRNPLIDLILSQANFCIFSGSLWT